MSKRKLAALTIACFLLATASLSVGLLSTLAQSPAGDRATSLRAESAPSAHNVELIGQLGGAVHTVFVQGNYAYVGEGAGMTVLDVSNPAKPKPVGRSRVWADAVEDIYVTGHYAYVAAGKSGLHIIDIANPAVLVEVGALVVDSHESARHVVVAGNYAYVAYYTGFWVVDVSNPAAPSYKGRFNAGAGPVGTFVVTGGYAYIPAATYGGLQIVDVSNPSAPAFVRNVSDFEGTSPWGVTVSGTHAYVTCHAGHGPVAGLFVLDITDPAMPTLVGRYLLDVFDGVAVAEDYAYAFRGGGYGSLLTVIDVSNPNLPVKVATYAPVDSTRDLKIAGGYAYLANEGGGLEILDVSDVAGPREVGYYYPPGSASATVMQGHYAYVRVADKGVHIVDVADPAAPRDVAVYTPPEGAGAMVVDGSLLYVVNEADSNDLRIVDLSTPTAPKEIAVFHPTAGSRWSFASLAKVGSYVYVGAMRYDTYTGGLLVIDVSDPAQPTQRNFGTQFNRAEDIAVAGNYAYLATGYGGGLQVVDLSNPITPTLSGFYAVQRNDNANLVAVTGTHAYLYVRGAGGNRLDVLDVSQPITPTQVGSYDLADAVNELAVSDHFVCLAMGSNGLRVVDISDPTHLIEAGYNDAWEANGVAVMGNYAYVAAGWKGFRVVDVSRVSPVSQTGWYNIAPANAQKVTVVGDYAYVADGGGGLKIVNVSNPATPVAVSSLDTSGVTRDVAVVGQYAYLADDGNGLVTANVSAPDAPQQVSVTRLSSARGITVRNDVAYIAAASAGLRIIAVSDPLSPTILYGDDYEDYLYTDTSVSALAITDSYAYLVSQVGTQEGLHAVDVSNPVTPTEVGYSHAWPAYNVALDNGHAYVAAGRSGLRVVDISSPTSLTETGSYAQRGEPDDVLVSGPYAYVAEGTGLRIVDVSNPALPTEVGFYAVGPNGYLSGSIAKQGPLVGVAAGLDGLRLINVSNPARPVETGVYTATDGEVEGVALTDRYAYLAVRWNNGGAGLQVVDIYDPAHPQATGYYETGNVGYGAIAVTGSTVLLGGEQNFSWQVWSIDVSNPGAPTLAGVYNAPYEVHDIVVAGKYAYVALSSSGLRILDIGDPAHPWKAGQVGGWGLWVFDLALDGNTLSFVTDTGIRVEDVSDPAHPKTISTYTMVNPRGVAAANNYLYVADYETGLRVLNASDPANPIEVGSYDGTGYTYRATASGSLAYTRDSKGIFRVIDVSNPATPVQVGFYSLPADGSDDEGGDITVAGNHIYVANGASGLYVLRFTGEQGGPKPYTLHLPFVTK
jgi:hypothetical protein